MSGIKVTVTDRYETINLFEGRECLSVIHLSDIHLWYSTVILETLKKRIEKNTPGLVIMTGDYYDVPKGAYNFREFLCGISAKYPVVFIRGNHDTIYGTKISQLLSGIPGCHCVEDVVFRYRSAKGLYYNITSWKNKRQLTTRQGEKNIVLIHNPEKIREGELTGIDLILAGHLHGGQVIFFRTKGNSNFPGNLLYRYCIDRTKIEDTILIVSKGLGDTFPLRINCPREVVQINIT